MNNISPEQGSIWNKWDLHLHSHKTFLANAYTDCNIDDFVKEIVASDIKVVGLTNYFCFHEQDLEEIKQKLNEKGVIVFPNLEFRTQPENKENQMMDIHVIFSDKVPISNIKNFLGRLKTIDDNYCNNLTQEQIEKTSITFDNLKSSLESDKMIKHFRDYILVACPRGHGNFRPLEKDGRGNNLAIIIDKKTDILFGNSEDTNFFLDTNRYSGAKAKPVVFCSDAHNLETIGTKYTWIKADLTFEGLKEIIYEPEERVYIGKFPEVLERVSNNKTKYIKKLEIKHRDGYKNEKGIWFNNVKINLNKELVAIIGNKGSCKSAISDILGLLGNTHNNGLNNENFSFLTNDPGKKKFRQKGFAENFIATLEWEDGSSITKFLNEEIDKTLPERVNYLPQNYFEKLTNDLDGREFEKKLKDVIFLHIPQEKRYFKETFQQLENYQSQSIEKDINLLKEDLKTLSSQIIILENKKHENYKKEIQSKLALKEKELEEHVKTKPDETIPDPSLDKTLDIKKKKIFEEIESINGQIRKLELEIETKRSQKIQLNSDREQIKQIVEDLERFKQQWENYQSLNKEKFKKYNIDIEQIVLFEFKRLVLDKKISSLTASIQTLETALKNLNQIELEFEVDLPKNANCKRGKFSS